MKGNEQRQVSRGRRGSSKAELALVGVASGKNRNLGSPSIPQAEGGWFVSCILPEPYAIRGRRVKRGERGRSKKR
jgi:hypothetical protein